MDIGMHLAGFIPEETGITETQMVLIGKKAGFIIIMENIIISTATGIW